MDQAPDEPAPADPESRKHELALMAAELRVIGPPVIGGRFRESLDPWHAPTLPPQWIRSAYAALALPVLDEEDKQLAVVSRRTALVAEESGS